MVHPSPEQSFSHSEPSFEHSSSSSPPSSPSSQRGYQGRHNADDWSGDSSLDYGPQPYSPSKWVSSCDASFEVILESESPRWFLRGSTSPDRGEDPGIERVSPTSKDTSHLHPDQSSSSKSGQRPRAFSVVDMRLVGAASFSARGKAEFDPTEASAAPRRASHDGVSLGHKKTSILPSLEVIPDDRTSEAAAGATLDPHASTFEPSTARDPGLTRGDLASIDSVELVIDSGKNEFGDLTKAARYKLAQRGLSTIPSLHGPLSLPYARCPSGIDAYLFSMDKEEDPWTVGAQLIRNLTNRAADLRCAQPQYAFDQEPGADRRSACPKSNMGRHAPVPLPGNARYLQGLHSVHSRVGSRVVSAPAEVGSRYTEPSGQSGLPLIPQAVLQHYAEDGQEGVLRGSVGTSQGAVMERESAEHELWRNAEAARSSISALDRLEAIIEPKRTKHEVQPSRVHPSADPPRDAYPMGFTFGHGCGRQHLVTCQRPDGNERTHDALYASPYESIGMMAPQFYLQHYGYESVGTPWTTSTSLPRADMSWQSNQVGRGAPHQTAHMPLPPPPPVTATSQLTSIYSTAQGRTLPPPPRGPVGSLPLRLFQDPAIIAASYASDPQSERETPCCHHGHSEYQPRLFSGSSGHEFVPDDTLSPYARSRPMAAAEYRRGSAESGFSDTTVCRTPNDSAQIPELITKKNSILSRRTSVPLQVASMRSTALPERRNSAAPAIPQIGEPRSRSFGKDENSRHDSAVPGPIHDVIQNSSIMPRSSRHMTDGTSTPRNIASFGNRPALPVSDLAPASTASSTEKQRKPRLYRRKRSNVCSNVRSNPTEAV
ncbi:BQ2448_1530 [Microbotryum intermedium]|uniref:BQ2448_1530 protein n=1 Tax=Microbotryum intermedium TaxID=269621 RepID=A0A238FGG6_9BASI|nr:BQ2448_1530 [Microbotryum intermedium]